MPQLLTGTTVIAAFFAGVVALFAPCCISVMLPAYLATGVQRRSSLVAMTFIFAAGVATVILPIAFGVTALSRLINEYHPILYTVMAVVMGALGIFMLLGHRVSMPMPGFRARQGQGAGRAYVLGVFSGVATACCAPVLAGAVVLAAASANFVPSLGVGAAYVFGMVAPLFAVALAWDGRKLGQARWLRAKAVKVSLFGRARYVPVSNLAGGLLLVAIAVITGMTAITGPASPTSGWQLRMVTTLQHTAHVLTTGAGHVPGWATALGLLAVLALLARMAVHQAAARAARDQKPTREQKQATSPQPEPHPIRWRATAAVPRTLARRAALFSLALLPARPSRLNKEDDR
ncbi:MAG: cytochrome c biogenesis CcdA family protein [Actinomycetota bacterium]|jgi:cytochrome c biogenesis protein CcdA|nr:cytochrome c biogenesis CcdA family protein [Actinomycetota bacterium]